VQQDVFRTAWRQRAQNYEQLQGINGRTAPHARGAGPAARSP
jgi:hypothetical protein